MDDALLFAIVPIGLVALFVVVVLLELPAAAKRVVGLAMATVGFGLYTVFAFMATGVGLAHLFWGAIGAGGLLLFLTASKRKLALNQTKSRSWTDSTGEYSVEASFLEVAEGNVRLLKKDGTETSISIEKLSTADQHWIAHQEHDETTTECD